MQVELALSWEKHFAAQHKARRLRMEQSALRHKAATIAAAALAAEKKAAALVAAKRAAAEAAAVARALSPTTQLTTIECIIHAVAEYYDITQVQICGRSNAFPLMQARGVVF